MRHKFIAVLGALMLSAGAMQAQAGTTTKAPMDINTATRTELASAGWGQYADAIIAGRPYKNMNDLVEKKVVPQKAYDKGYGNFTIGDGNSPLSDGNSAQPMTPPAATPPTLTPGNTPTTPSTTPGTTPATTPGVTQTPATPLPTTPAAPTAPTQSAPGSQSK
jgi:hypothetical protein